MHKEPFDTLPANISDLIKSGNKLKTFLQKKITIRVVQVALGSLWLLDGILQFQPKMFTSQFVSGVITPAASGQPIFVAGPMHFLAHIFLFHPAILNAMVAITQLGIAALILIRKTTKLGLMASIGWGLFVWVIGEGYGGIFGGHTILLMGAPGAALLYVILAITVMPRGNKQNAKPPSWLALVWASLWIGGAIYQLLPGQNSVSSVSSMIRSNATGQPGWLGSIDYHVGNIINHFGTPSGLSSMHMTARQMAKMHSSTGSGYWFILLLVLIQLLIGLAIFSRGYYKDVAIICGIILCLIFWVIGQSFGGIFTGLSTDPNAGPLFIILAIALIGTNTTELLMKLGQRIVGLDRQK